jgi:hypothetical protein
MEDSYTKIYDLIDFPETDFCGRDFHHTGWISHVFQDEIPFPKEHQNQVLLFEMVDSKFLRLCCADWLNSSAYCLYIGSQVKGDFRPIYEVGNRFYITYEFADGTKIVLFNAY